jgi:hypothetical protein
MRRYRRAASLTAEVLAALTQAERARILVLDAHVYRFAHDVVRGYGR